MNSNDQLLVNIARMNMTAELFAVIAHGYQKYGKKFPYSHHLQRVVDILEKFGYNDEVFVNAGWLHDTLEDTEIQYRDLYRWFGKEVADLVLAVTDLPSKNRKECHEMTYPGIKQYGYKAVVLKLADRIANVTFSITMNDTKKLKMYRKEQADFERLLRDADISYQQEKMWEHLNFLLS